MKKETKYKRSAAVKKKIEKRPGKKLAGSKGGAHRKNAIPSSPHLPLTSPFLENLNRGTKPFERGKRLTPD